MDFEKMRAEQKISENRMSMIGFKRLGVIGPTLLAYFLILVSGFVALAYFNGTFGVSRYLFVILEIPAFLLAGLILAALASVVFILSDRNIRFLSGLKFESIPLPVIALVTGLISIASTNLVYKGYALSMDEWMPRLQADIFLSGKLVGQIAPEWREYGRALFHVFAKYNIQTGEVVSNYRPGMALIIAGFKLIGIGIYTSAFLNAGAVWLVAIVTKQIYPSSKSAPVIAAILLATSQQAMAFSLTSYAMTGHLFFNLLWLHLFLRDTVRAHVMAAIVGVVTASLHQVHMHLFFALPFLLTLLRPARFKIIAIYFFIYLFGHLAILSWDKVLTPYVAQGVATNARRTLDVAVNISRIPDSAALASVWANLTRMVAWQNLALVPLILVFLASRTANKWTWLLLASLAFSLSPYLILMPDQGHGWGYRYLNGLLGNLAIIAAIGWTQLGERIGTARDKSFVVLLMIVSPVALLPLRAASIENFLAPYYAATRLTMSQDADVVIVDTPRIFVGSDIARNRPTEMHRPVAMSLHRLTPEKIIKLCNSYNVKFLSAEEYASLGVRTFDDPGRMTRERYSANIDALRSEDCARGN